jgi:paraquat-inducible protein B
MSKRANPAVIGGFVIGAVALTVAGVIIFGSGKFFADTVSVVMYFTGDLKGLRVGGRVAFEGVPIGTVTDLGVFVDAKDYSTRAPVVVAINRDSFRLVGESKLPEKGHALKPLVEQKGLRAQLQSESLVTGQLFIQLAFYPAAPPAHFTVDPLTKLPEIPTIPTTLQQVQDTVRKALVKFGELPLEQIITTLNETLKGINRLVNAPEVTESVRALKTALGDVQQLVRNVDKQVEIIVPRFTSTLGNVNQLMGDMSKLTRDVNGHVPEVVTSFTDAAKSAQKALDQAQQTLVSVNGFTDTNSPVRYEMTKALRELSEAARALRALADYLERYPNAVIFGRNASGAQ